MSKCRFDAGVVVAIAAIGLLCLSIGLAAPSKEGTDSDEKARQLAEQVKEAGAGNPVMQSMRVYRDPETGQLGRAPGPPLALSPGEQRMLSRSTQGLTSRVLPNGTVALDLKGGFMNLSIATRNADGKMSMNCVDHPDQAEQHFHSNGSPAEPGSKEVRDVR